MREKIYIAFPVAMSGNINVQILNFLFQVMTDYDIVVGCEMGNQIAHNRNKLIERFLKTNIEWIFFIDTDTVPPINALDMTKHKLDICSGYYYQWINHQDINKRELMPLIFEKVEKGYKPFKGRPTKIKNVVEADGAGAGCLLINRRVFANIERPYFLTPHDEKGFTTSTEDIYFFKKIQKAGYKLYIDTSIVADHVKTVNLTDIAQWNYRVQKLELNKK